MPVSDPDAGRTFIWLIACILLISILAGGGCLVAYLVLPESEITPWMPVIGVSLVCLPWAFWICTFLYRIVSRWCGYRIGIGDVNGGDGNIGRTTSSAHGNANGKGGAHAIGINRVSSVASHESEMPLAQSMSS